MPRVLVVERDPSWAHLWGILKSVARIEIAPLEGAVQILQREKFDAIVFSGRTSDDVVTAEEIFLAIRKLVYERRAVLFIADDDPLLRKFINMLVDGNLPRLVFTAGNKPDLMSAVHQLFPVARSRR
ncbi:MAG: hypothetical protein V1489_02105 [Candidatus Liptonbacteria bacterium]